MDPYEYEALDREEGGGQTGQLRMPMNGGRNQEPDSTDKLQNAQCGPSLPRQGTEDETPWLTFSNMKTFITPDAPYRSAASVCSIHNRIFIMRPQVPDEV